MATQHSLSQYDNIESWVKMVLINQLVESGAHVCELQCGQVVDLGKWQRAKIGAYIGVDCNQNNINKSESICQQRGVSFNTEFHCTSISQAALSQFHIIACFHDLSQYFESKESMDEFISFISSHLHPGGYFMGILPDSSTIWTKSQKSDDSIPRAKGELYRILFHGKAVEHFGTKFSFDVKGTTAANEPSTAQLKAFGATPGEKVVVSRKLEEYLVHFPSLLCSIRKHNLETIEICNMKEFLNTHRKFYEEGLKMLNCLDKRTKKISHASMDLLSLKSTLVIQKPLAIDTTS